MSKQSFGLTLALLVALTTLGCAQTKLAPPDVYDLGLPPVLSAEGPRWQVRTGDVAAAPWLSETGMHYRLQYRDAYQREQFRDSRWAAPPALLVTRRLRDHLAQHACGAAGAEPPLLQLTLDEFSQVFDAPGQSQVLVRLRASLDGGSERIFEVRRAALQADARGAVQAYAQAVDVALLEVAAWAVKTAPAAACI